MVLLSSTTSDTTLFEVHPSYSILPYQKLKKEFPEARDSRKAEGRKGDPSLGHQDEGRSPGERDRLEMKL